MGGKKTGFWILLLFSGLLVLSGLAVNPVNEQGDLPMMALSMGGMMKIHHASQLQVAELLKPITENHGMGNTEGHHLLAPLLESMAFLTTITVFIFLPLLLGGTMMLLILWF